MPSVSSRVVGATLLIAAVGAMPVWAQGSQELTLVPRVGVSLSPEQATLGVEAPIANVADITYLVFAPSLDFGWGDERTSVRANANLGYSIPTSSDDTRVFPLVGLAAFFQSFDSIVEDGDVIDSSDTSFGVNIGAGAQVGELVVEALIGLGDLPGLAILVGYSLIL